MRFKTLKVREDIYYKLREIVNDLSYTDSSLLKGPSIDLFEVNSTEDLLAPVPEHYATKTKKVNNEEVPCFSTRMLKGQFLTKRSAEDYIEEYKEILDEPLISAGYGMVINKELKKLAELLLILFKDDKNEKKRRD